MTCALVFPGQGSQAVGMGNELFAAFPSARETLEAVDDALGRNLSGLIAAGPLDELTLTENAQPALMAVSMAALRILETEAAKDVVRGCVCVAGHSLGEYTALAAARGLALDDAARLLRRRGEAMQEAVPVGEGGMAALLGADLALAREIADQAAEGSVCAVANDNAPGQVVLSGAAGAIERAIRIAAERGVRRSVRLPVSAPFHCAMMAPAAAAMKEALAATALSSPAAPLVANATAAPVDDADEIRVLLVKQVTAMVRWRESILAMREMGVDTVIELGAGKVLSGLTRRIAPELKSVSVGAPGDVETALGLIGDGECSN